GGSGGGNEVLRDDGAQGVGELYANLALALRRIGIDDPFDSRRRGAAVQAGEYQMPGLGGGERQTDGLGITHLADQEHIRILTQGITQAGGEIAHVGAHFALADKRRRAHWSDNVLERIFERHPDLRGGSEGVLDERRQRRALAATRRPAGDDQPVLQLGERLELWR